MKRICHYLLVHQEQQEVEHNACTLVLRMTCFKKLEVLRLRMLICGSWKAGY
jgi:hypothetical protein